MACLDGVCCSSGSSFSTEIIRPAGLEADNMDEAPRVKLLLMEMMFARVPLSAASYPALAFRLSSCNACILKASLATALAAHPMLAGRLRGREVVLTNDGVPFTVCDDAAGRAPEDMEEGLLLRFADFRPAQRVRKGLEPLLTVKLTRFRDGSAVLAMCRSHALLDGTSAWAFLADWAAAAKGQPLRGSTSADRAAIQRLLPSDAQIDEIAMDLHGKTFSPTWKSWAMECALKPVAAVWDRLFLGGVAFPNRPRLFLSDAALTCIKAAATPAPWSAGDGWVSTQEAVTAYILLTVCRSVLPADSQGRALLLLLLDSQKSLGLPDGICMGCSLALIGLQVQGILQMGLAEVAHEIHEAAKAGASPDALRKHWLLGAGLGEQKMPFEAMDYLMKLRAKSDITLQLNNQSKRKLPDFGADGSGGRARAVLTNAGPTLILPAPGGVEILFCPSFLGAGRRAKTAMEALRSQVPDGTSGPTLLDSERCAVESKGHGKIVGEKADGSCEAQS